MLTQEKVATIKPTQTPGMSLHVTLVTKSIDFFKKFDLFPSFQDLQSKLKL